MGFYEARLAAVLIYLLERYLEERNLGVGSATLWRRLKKNDLRP